MKKNVGWWVLSLVFTGALSQVDTTYIYKTNAPYGTLDLRIAKSATRYLSEGTSIVPPQKMAKGIYLLIIQQGEKLIKQRIVVTD